MRVSRLIVMAALLCHALAAQSDRETAEHLMSSAKELANQKSPEVLRHAGADYQSAAVLWRKLGDAQKEVEALEAAAWAHYALHELPEMSGLLTSAMEVASKAELPASRAELLAAFAVLHNTEGQYTTAADEYKQAAAIYEGLGNTLAVTQVTSFQANSWRMQGNAAEKAQNPASALEAHRQAAVLFEKAKDSKRAGQEYLKLGQISENVGTPAAWEQAAGFFQTAIPLLEASGDRVNRVVAGWGLGSVTDSLGQPERSRDALLKVLPWIDELKNPKAEGIILKLLANAESKLGEFPKAVEHYERALPLFAAAKDPTSQFITGMKLGKAQEALGRNDQATAAYREVVRPMRMRPGTIRTKPPRKVRFAYSSSPREIGTRRSRPVAHHRSCTPSSETACPKPATGC